jgi:HD-GYP domain-containing protein (c-di-GMP phosphodiesterase class II)
MSTSDNSVNPHFLAHMTSAGAAYEAAAIEDIVTANGIKLLAKDSRIDATTCNRLLKHTLKKPLEDSVRMVGGVDATAVREAADRLSSKHGLLRSICADGRSPSVGDALAGLKLTPQLQTLLTVYVQQQPGRLEHTVGVAMLALALARRLLPGESEQHRALATAGLLHDLGELYIEPALLSTQRRLDPSQWRHIATHPIVGHRVLLAVSGGGRLIAEAVRDHHERLDGFGYPRGIRGAALSVPGQLLAASEWLMAMLDSGLTPVSRVSTATKLIQGEFSPPVVELLHQLAKKHKESLGAVAEHDAGIEDASRRLGQLERTLGNFRAAKPWLDERIADVRAPLRRVIEGSVERLLRVQTAFASTGLDRDQPQALLRELAAADDLGMWFEVTSIVRELGWRMREIERTSLLRAGLLSSADQQVMQEVVTRLSSGEPIPA